MGQGFRVGIRGGEGVVGTGKETGKSMRTRLSKLPFSKLPGLLLLSFFPTVVFYYLYCFPLRIGTGVGKQGYGNRPPIDDRNPIRKFSIDCLGASSTNE